MAKIKLTKNELKKQRDALKRYTRYLPTLELKKQQLLAEIRRIQDEARAKEKEQEELKRDLDNWVAVFAEDIDLTDLFNVTSVKTGQGNIAGIDIPVFQEMLFKDVDYDLMAYPLWVDKGVEVTKKMISLEMQLGILHSQEDLIQEELLSTVQRINLFDKVKIPESRLNIKRIQIFMSDQDTAAVVRGKMSKTKIQKKSQQAG